MKLTTNKPNCFNQEADVIYIMFLMLKTVLYEISENEVNRHIKTEIIIIIIILINAFLMY